MSEIEDLFPNGSKSKHVRLKLSKALIFLDLVYLKYITIKIQWEPKFPGKNVNCFEKHCESKNMLPVLYAVGK